MNKMIYVVFFSTSDVFEAEDRFIHHQIPCEIVPTPVTDKAYCGVCVKVDGFNSFECIQDMEFETIEIL